MADVGIRAETRPGIYETFTTANPNPLMRWSHGARFRIALEMLAPSRDDNIIDVGCGAGTFLQLLRTHVPDDRLAGVEKWPEHRAEAVAKLGPAVRIYEALGDLPDDRFTMATCLETLEHVGDRPRLLRAIARLLRPGGVLLVSVPIEIGPVSLVKNIVRASQGGAHDNATFASVWKAFAYAPRAIGRRIEDDSIGSHVGFDFRELGREFAAVGLRTETKRYSPIPIASHLVNSQLFYRLRKG